MPESSEVCVIGAGPGGILSVKYCLEYNLSVIAYDTRNRLGGLWSAACPEYNSVDRDVDPKSESQVGAHDRLHLNSSQYTSTYSDFPMPDDLLPSRLGNGRYLSAAQFLQYLDRYAEAFNVRPHVRLGTRVIHVTRLKTSQPDVEIFKGRHWAVTVQGPDGSEYTTHHKYVVMATGAFSQARLPEFKGMDKTKINCLHTGHLRNTREAFQGKRVLVIGGSISAFDITQVALKAEADKIIHAAMRSDPTKRNIYLLHRMIPGTNLAWDEFYSVFSVRYFTSDMKDKLLQRLSEMVYKYSDQATVDRTRDSIGVMDDGDYNEARRSGRYKLIPYTVDRFIPDTNKVLLTNGEVFEVDTCMLSTGYDMKYPYLDDEVQASRPNDKENLYRLMVSTTKEAWGLMFLYSSCILGNGLITTEGEVRWLIHNIATGALEGEKKRVSAMKHEKPAYYDFCEPLCYELIEDLSKEIGCQPPLWPAFFHPSPRQRRIGLATLWGPWLSHMYRLRGPHAKEEMAAKAIIRVARELIGWKFDAVAVAIDCAHLALVAGAACAAFKYMSSCSHFQKFSLF